MACKRSAVRSRLAPPNLIPLNLVRKGTVGAIAQLGERLHGMHEVSGSIPLSSTKIETLAEKRGFFVSVSCLFFRLPVPIAKSQT